MCIRDRLDDFVNKLQLAYDVHFGGMEDEVTNFLEQQQDRELGVFNTSSDLIAALETEIAKRAELEVAIKNQTDRVTEATEDVFKAESNLARVLGDIAEKSDEIVNTITSIQTLGKEIDTLAAKINNAINRIEGRRGSSSGRRDRTLERIASTYGQEFTSQLTHAIRTSGTAGEVFSQFQDFVQRPGQRPVRFSPNDTIIGINNPSRIGNTVTIGNINVNGGTGDPQEMAQIIAIEIKRELDTL